MRILSLLQLVLELPRQHGLAELARVGALVAHVGVLDELLGDGGAALDDRAGAQVEDHGAGDALVVDAVVLVEALVLHGHGGLLHDLRDLVAGHEHAVLGAVQLGDDALAGAVVQHRVDGVGVAVQVLERRQVAGEGVDGAGGEGEAGDHREQHGDDEELDHEPGAAAGLRLLLLAFAPAPRDVLGLDAVPCVLSHGLPFYPRGTRRPSAAFTRARGWRSRRPRRGSLQRRVRPPSSAARTGRAPPRPRRARTAARTWRAC